MKKVLLSAALIATMATANAQATYDLFDPADLDAQGWLWFDSAEKIAKYVGADKAIKLFDADYEIDDPDFPGEKIAPKCVANHEQKGYNTEGVLGGEGSWTGALTLPASEGRGWFDGVGGSFLFQIPDLKIFEVAVSSPDKNIYTQIQIAKDYVNSIADTKYIWSDDDYDELWAPESSPLLECYTGYGLNIHDRWYDFKGTGGQGPDADVWYVKSEPGEKRTVAFQNLTEADLHVHGVRILSHADAANFASVKGIAADEAVIAICGKVISVNEPTEIEVYAINGIKVAATYGTTLDAAELANGLYIVKAAGKTVKAIF